MKRILKLVKPFLFPFAAILFIVIGIVFPLMNIMVFAVLLLYVLLEKDDSKVTTLIFGIVSFATVFKISASSISLFTVLEFALSIRIVIKRKLPMRNVLCWLAFLIICLPGLFLNFSETIKILIIPIFVYYFVDINSKEFLFRIIKVFVLSFLASSVVALGKDFIPNLKSLIVVKTYGGLYSADRFSGLQGDPNYYSLNVILSFYFIFFLLLNKKINIVLALGLESVLVYFGVITGSKSFLLMLAVIFVSFIILLFKKKKFFYGITLTIASFVVFFLIISGKITIFDNITARLTSSLNSGDFTTGRTEIWLNYFAYMNSHPFVWVVGNGFGNELVNQAEAHNTIIQMIYNWGFFGVIVFATIIVFPVKRYYKNITFFSLLPLLIFIVMNLFLSSLMYLDFKYHLLLCMLFIFNNRRAFFVKNGNKVATYNKALVNTERFGY